MAVDKEKTDLFVFHQANKFMNEKICKKQIMIKLA